MALLRLQIPKRTSSSPFLEDIFYRRYPHLNRIKLKNFVDLSVYAGYRGYSYEKAKLDIIKRKSIFALELVNQNLILIHPKALFALIGKQMIRDSKSL